MKRNIKSNWFYKIAFIIICSGFLIACKNDEKIVIGNTPKKPAPTGLNKGLLNVHKPSYIFAGGFNVVNSGYYRDLMEVCRRCGTKRLIQTPYGSTYQRSYTFGLGESLKKCQNWLNEGFLQIEFQENRLPTSAKVLIQPQYKGSQVVWGEAFELTAVARPINENKGFEIFISPQDGLNGVYNLILSSNNDNHVKDSDLYVSVLYGPRGEVIADPSLKQYTKRWVEAPKYTCEQYTN